MTTKMELPAVLPRCLRQLCSLVRIRAMPCYILLLAASAILTSNAATEPVAFARPAVTPIPNEKASGQKAPDYFQKRRLQEALQEELRAAAERERKNQAPVQMALSLAKQEHERVEAQLNAPPPPPRFVDKHKSWLVFLFVGVLFTLLMKLAAERHEEEAELRELAGGYLSDGTEVARFAMPDLFAAPETEALVPASGAMKAENRDDRAMPPHLAAFYEAAPRQVGALSDLLKDLNSLGELEERRHVLLKMNELLTVFIQAATPWALRPAWQVGTALQLLVDRIAQKPNEATVSVVRTIASSLDALRDLCVPGIRPNLILEPPLKVLAADDDRLCRKAVAFALEKAGLSADFAENGQQALDMASATAYDMVFLDIQMPEMDGLTACTKIRETKKNAQTPVVFVTVQTDFVTRAQTTAMGSEFIAKPFLVFEITMKAIICATRKRLALLPRNADGGYVIADTPNSLAPSDASTKVQRKSKATTAAADAHLRKSFYDDAPGYLNGIADLLDDISVIADDRERKAATSDLYLRLLTLHTAARENDLTVATRVASAVEALAKKMDAAPKNVTPSTLRTMAAGVRLLEQLCVPDADYRLSRAMPVRSLVVEDEPLARRAVVGALQLAFERPDSANDGAAALAMAAKRPYDVIFSDIEMPGMDGFELCRKLRAEGLNSTTPIVFITSHVDAASRIQAAQVGGTDFIAKPFLPVEITVKALTLAYERQLASGRAANTSPALSAV